ncbi:hypothetical protein B0H14DRAFT_2681387 [Mycena olivaceomarginata]|nr:hypothetical protein B0H14DRAFT_2681387 [Mycena olivaceomarginata]
MSDYQPLFEELQIVLAHTAVTHYAIASSLCLYAYEFLLTFSAEGSPWTFVKANRYFPIPAIAYVAFCKCSLRSLKIQIDTETCVSFYSAAINRTPTLPLCFAGEAVGIILSLVCIGGAQVIMQLRVHALYGQNRRLKIALSCLFVFEEANELGIAIAKLATDNGGHIQPIPFLVDPLTLCVETIPKFLFAYPIPSMVFDTILLVLVVYKTYLIQREETLDKSWTGARLVRLMFRDSVMYFACTVGFNLFNLLIWILGPYDLFTAGTAWAVSVPVMAASRVLLNMRKTYYRSNTDTLDGEIGTEFQVARRPQGSKGPAVWSSSSSRLESGIDDV